MARRHGWSEEQISDLANFRNRSDFTDAEKGCHRTGRAHDPGFQPVDDAFWNELRKYYDEGEIIELLAAIGLFNYFNRFNNALHMEPTK